MDSRKIRVNFHHEDQCLRIGGSIGYRVGGAFLAPDLLRIRMSPERETQHNAIIVSGV